MSAGTAEAKWNNDVIPPQEVRKFLEAVHGALASVFREHENLTCKDLANSKCISSVKGVKVSERQDVGGSASSSSS